MTIADIKKNAEQKMAKSIDAFKNELAKIRTMLGDIDTRLKKLESAPRSEASRGPANVSPPGPSRGQDSRSNPGPGISTRGPGSFNPPGPSSMSRGPDSRSAQQSRQPQGPMPRMMSNRSGGPQVGRGKGGHHHDSFGQQRGGSPMSASGSGSDISRRLDQLIQEIDDLKRSLSRR